MKIYDKKIKKWWQENYQGFSLGWILNFNFGKNKKNINAKKSPITMVIKTNSYGFHEFYVKNSGERPVKTIRIVNIDFEFTYNDTWSPKGKQTGEKFRPQFQRIDSLAVGQELKIYAFMDSNEKGIITLENDRIKNIPYSIGKKVKIIYTDLQDEDWFTLMQISRKESEILEHEKINT